MLHTPRHRIPRTVITVLSLALLCLCPPIRLNGQAAKSSISEGPALTLYTTSGPVASISNYSIKNGQFCFTVTNLSNLTITNIGHRVVNTGHREWSDLVRPSKLTYAGAGTFSFDGLSSYENDDPNNPSQFNVDTSIDAWTVLQFEDTFRIDGIPPYMSTSFCVAADLQRHSASEIARNLIVILAPSLFTVSADCDGGYRIDFTELTDTRTCFSITNTLGVDAITGLGFVLPNRNVSLISVSPDPQPNNQNLIFSNGPPDPSLLNALAFSISSGSPFLFSDTPGGDPSGGIQPQATSSTFCLSGDFSGLIRQDIRFSSYGRTANYTRQCQNSHDGGRRGTLATVP